MSMKNIDKMQQIYTDLVDALYDISQGIAESTDFEMIDADLATADKISVILKRMGETPILEIGEAPEEAVDDHTEEDIVVEEEDIKGGEKNERKRENSKGTK